VTPVVGPRDRDARIIEVEALVVASPTSPLSSESYEELLALADDELVIGHRHSEWLGLSPFLEEDLTLSSIAQDEFGHARALYALIWPEWTEREAGITRRPASEWRSCGLVELDGRPWERSLVRHLLYDVAEPHRWRGIAERHPNVSGLAALAEIVCAEETFHARHATELVTRLGRDADANVRLQAQLDFLAPQIDSLAIGMNPAGWVNFLDDLADVLNRADLVLARDPAAHVLHAPRTAPGEPRDRSARHRDFGDIHRSLLDVVAFDPAARW
jgi:Phenylacetic acid catabolic protein